MNATMGIMGIMMANNWVALSPPAGSMWYSMATLSQTPWPSACNDKLSYKGLKKKKADNFQSFGL